MDGVFITGSGTGVGKTFFSSLLIARLRREGITVIPRKPVESGCENIDGTLRPDDAFRLIDASGFSGELDDVCGHRFEAAISPARAAMLEGIELKIEQLVTCCQHNEEGFTLVEGAGGFYSPIAEDGLNADLAEKLALPVILVASDELGCINDVLLSTEAIMRRGLRLSAIALSQVKTQASDTDMDNLQDLRDRIDIPVFMLRHQADITDIPDTLLNTLAINR